MFNSLRLVLLLAMLSVAGLAIATMALFATWTTRQEFTRYVAYDESVRSQTFDEAVFTVWSFDDDEASARSVVIDPKVRAALSESYESAIVLDPANFQFVPLGGTNPDVRAAIPLSDLRELRFVTTADGRVQAYHENRPVGLLYTNPELQSGLLAAQGNFLRSVNASMLLAASLGGVAASLVTLFMARRVFNPIHALIRAARDLESGKPVPRIELKSYGEIAELGRAFDSLATTLRQNEELRQHMVSDIAHELRTPLTNIRGYLEAVQDGVVEPDAHTIDLIYEEVMLLNRIIQDLQELALAEAGQLHYARQPFDLAEIIEQTTALVEARAVSREIEIITDLRYRLPQAYADPARVAQILRNLLNNALNYTPEGGRITIHAAAHLRHIEIHVSDTGTGIAEEHLPYLFERFYRVDPSRSRITGGAGLGLAIVKQLVEAQGGRIRVESDLGQGTRFVFSIPVYTPEPNYALSA